MTQCNNITIHNSTGAGVTKHRFTKKEIRIIDLIGNGFTNREVALKLLIREKTVKTHLTHIFIKLNFQNRYQLMIYANRLKRRVR